MGARRRLDRSKGRRSFAPALILRKDIIESPEWAALSPFEVKLLIDLGAQYKGSNNGDLCAAWSVMRSRGWRSPGTLHAALRGLIEKGWVDITRQGGRHLASLYALTIWGINECAGKLDVTASAVPSHRWRKSSLGSREVYQPSREAHQSAA